MRIKIVNHHEQWHSTPDFRFSIAKGASLWKEYTYRWQINFDLKIGRKHWVFILLGGQRNPPPAWVITTPGDQVVCVNDEECIQIRKGQKYVVETVITVPSSFVDDEMTVQYHLKGTSKGVFYDHTQFKRVE
jgi:hypothetical protein